MIRVGQNDTAPLDVVLRQGGRVIDLTGATVTFKMSAQSGSKVVTGTCSVANMEDPRTGNTVKGARLNWQTGDLDTPGLYRARHKITFPGGEVQTVPGGDQYETVEVGTAL